MGIPAPPGGKGLQNRGSLGSVLFSHAPVILQEKQTRPAEAPRLKLSSGFAWDVELDSLTPALPPREESSDSEEDEKPEQATVLYFPGLRPLQGPLAPVSRALSYPGCLFRGVGPSQAGSICGARGLPCQLLTSTTDFPGAEEQVAHLVFCLPQQKKKSRKERELEKQKAEKELSRIEEALMDPGRQPESADDFDRLVLSSPNSSILWLQYMAFHLQATEIEKARAVAERALKTISFRSRLCPPALGPCLSPGGAASPRQAGGSLGGCHWAPVGSQAFSQRCAVCEIDLLIYIL